MYECRHMRTMSDCCKYYNLQFCFMLWWRPRGRNASLFVAMPKNLVKLRFSCYFFEALCLCCLLGSHAQITLDELDQWVQVVLKSIQNTEQRFFCSQQQKRSVSTMPSSAAWCEHKAFQPQNPKQSSWVRIHVPSLHNCKHTRCLKDKDGRQANWKSSAGL